EAGVVYRINDAATRQLVFLHQVRDVQAIVHSVFRRQRVVRFHRKAAVFGKRLRPNQGTLIGIGEREAKYRVEPAHECVIDIADHVRRQDNEPIKIFNPLKQIGHFLVGIFVVCIAHVRTFSKQRVDSVEKSIQPLSSPRSNSGARFRSVSPMYFDTTIDRSILYTSFPSSFPSSPAVSVFPVPGGPQKSARYPFLMRSSIPKALVRRSLYFSQAMISAIWSC